MNIEKATRLPILPVLVAAFQPLHSSLPAQDVTPSRSLPDGLQMAWAEVEKVHQALRPPDDWRSTKPTPEQVSDFQKQICRAAASYPGKAREFILRFPTNGNVGDARITVVFALTHAVAAGDTNAEKLISGFVSAVLADKSIPEDDRVGVLMYAGNSTFMKKVGMRLFTEGMSKLQDEFETHSIDSMREALKQFPTNSMIYTILVAIADSSPAGQQKELANEILNAPGAPPEAKTQAKHILKGTKPYQVGKPLDIRFTALDGREVDLIRLKGKVVLVDFWSTTCGPCIGEMPNIQAVYKKLHDRGFEIVAISLDADETALRRFVQDKELPWPQHFDGKGRQNQFAVRYGIFSIPALWLVDKSGNLRDTDARSNLERQVSALLEAQ